jgi:hypothetical protein
MIQTLKLWLGLMIAIGCAGCQAQGNFPKPVVTVEVVTAAPPTGTPDCLPVPGVTIELHPITTTSVRLIATGLQLGEKPDVFYSAQSIEETKRFEDWGYAQGADGKGMFSLELTGLAPLRGQSRSTWDVRLVHARGVACAKITLP